MVLRREPTGNCHLPYCRVRKEHLKLLLNVRRGPDHVPLSQNTFLAATSSPATCGSGLTLTRLQWKEGIAIGVSCTRNLRFLEVNLVTELGEGSREGGVRRWLQMVGGRRGGGPGSRLFPEPTVSQRAVT